MEQSPLFEIVYEDIIIGFIDEELVVR